ncbi:MAG: FAD-dependent oxidoreductase [Verrucomicrobiota bacterium]|jgi:NADPH-dependent 2,4-dienoyl-CoA reductase/sulfur reductase-like enzyme/rhodanese-related sulfurtransferase
MKNPHRIVIVGGVAGGASAAAKARRVDENADIQIFERGPYISFANCGLPYFIAGEIDDRSKLIVMTPEKFWERSRVRAHVNHEVLSINRAAKTICVKEPDGRQRDVPYDKLVLSQGAKAIVPPIPGADLPHVFTLRDIPDMDRIAAFLNERQPRHAVVIGGGFIGLEMAEAFHHRGLHVTIVERNPHILPLLDRDMAVHLQNQIRRDDFDFKSGAEAARFTAGGVEFADGSRLPADLILMSVGVKAEVELARAAGLEIGETGGVKTNGRLESSDPSIYAVGDAAETMHALTGARARIALAGPANRQGRIAGANAAGARLIYPGALGTSIVRVLNMTAGFTGLNSAQARKAGFTFFTSLTRDPCHAHYYPGAKPVLIKLVAEEGTGRLLGAQILGESGIDKRVDVLATAITGKMSVFDLESLDLAYSPPFGSANDPVNTAGFVAGHIARGDLATVAPETWQPDGEYLLDVRDADEVEKFGKLKNAVNIPLAQLRDRLAELPCDRRIVTYCQKGQRGYLAACALHGRGFEDVANLRGGFLQTKLLDETRTEHK